jgi:AraC-like DNA-binding protein
MLTSSSLLATSHVLVRDLECSHERGGWAGVELAPRSAIVFARRGSFRRRGWHGEEVVEPGVAYFQRAGEEEEFAHPHHGGDRCVSVGIADAVLASLLGGDPTLPAAPVYTAPRDDLALRLLGGASQTLTPYEASSRTPSEDRVVALVASVLAAALPERVASGRPATARARRALAADARGALAADPSLGLVDLARLLAVSPHHLSRVFRAEVGVSVSTYRRRLRVRDALERLSGGGSLARVAADAGFADHAHLTREVRSLLGTTPSALQREIARALDEPG